MQADRRGDDVLEGFSAVLLGAFDEDVFDDEGLREDVVQALRARLTGVLPPDDLARFLAILQ